jgi:hypothetical protein
VEASITRLESKSSSIVRIQRSGPMPSWLAPRL